MPDRIIDIPLESLAFIDEHFIEVAAPTELVWEALLGTIAEISGARIGAPLARALGCAHTESGGEAGEIGSTIPGFVVARSVRPGVLALMGQHRFSRYALIFSILEKPSGLALLSAQTRADFPGVRGKLYRGAIVGSRGHVVVATRILRAVRRRAERKSAQPPRQG